MAETKKKSTWSRLWIAAAVILIVVVAAVFLGSSYNQKISEQLYTERSQALITVTQKSADGMDILMQNAWVSLNSAEKLLQYNKTEHPELYEKSNQLGDRALWLQDCLQLDRNTKFNGVVMLLDSNLKVYTGDGHKGRWEEIDFLHDEQDTCITRLSYQSEDSNSIFILQKLSEKIDMGRTQITHVILNIPVDSFANLFHVAEYKDQNFTYVVGRDGERMCRYQQSASFIDTYNVLHLLEDAKYVDGATTEEIRRCLSDDGSDSCCISFEHEGTSYYAATAKLNGTDWHIISFVPTDILSDTAEMFRKSTYTFFLELTLLILVAVIGCIILVISSANQSRINRQQEIMNAQLAEAAEKAEKIFYEALFHAGKTHREAVLMNGGIRTAS